MIRGLWGIAGVVALALGAIGIALPLLPTVPFLLLATFCFARSSPRMHQWLVSHPVFGPQILAWQTHGAISRRAKIMATLSVLAVFGLSLALGLSDLVLVLQAVTLSAVMTFIWTRPEGPRPEARRGDPIDPTSDSARRSDPPR